MQLTITTNFPEVQRQIDALQREVATKATARALNRTVEQARTAMSREIRSEYVIDARFVRDRLRVKRASFASGLFFLQAALEAQAKPRSANLIRFGAKQVRDGVSVKIKRTGPRKTLRGAFIGNKGRTVFQRRPGTRMPSRKWGGKHGEKIKALQTIDVPQMFNARRINAKVVSVILERFPTIWQREAAYAVSQFNAK